MKHRSKAYSELHTLMLSLRNDTKKDLSVLCSGMRSRTLDKILDTRAARKKEGQLLKMNDVLKIKSKGKSAFVSDPSAATLAKYIVYYEDRFATGKELNKMHYPSTVVSIDIGKVNSAYAVVDCTCQEYRVREWSMLDLGLPQPYSPGRCYDNVSKALEMLPKADIYLIERQSHQNPGKQGFLAISLQLRCLEAMVYAILSQKQEALVHSLLPRLVASYFEIKADTRPKKKRLTVELAMCLIDQKQRTPLGMKVCASDEVAEYFRSMKKKDDLGDSLLQALALLDWSQMCRGLEMKKRRKLK